MRIIAGLLACVALGVGVGYYLGLDHGFERAVRAMTLSQQVHTQPERIVPRVSIDDVRAGIIGEWKSSEDAAFTRVFRADGTVTDVYANTDRTESEGTWHVFTSPTDEKTPFALQPNTIYLKLFFAEEVLYFAVASITKETLVLSYLDRGEVLSFSRIHID